jgi:hypothetical protein
MRWSSGRGAALVLFALCSGPLLAEERPAKAPLLFTAYRAADVGTARQQALAWLRDAGQANADSWRAFDAVWSTDRPTLEKVADTFALGDSDAARLLAEARDPAVPPPTALPAVLTDARRPLFYRGNLALTFARALANRRVYEEALEALRPFKPEQTVDPASYLFCRATAEYALLRKQDAEASLARLLDDTANAPGRYQAVAAAMQEELAAWEGDDLGRVARLMDNVERRLDLSRGGPETQRLQREVVARLDEIIRALEDGGDGPSPDDPRPPGPRRERRPGDNPGPPNPARKPEAAAPEDYVDGPGGPGDAEIRKWMATVEGWGKLPDKERAQAILGLARAMPPKHRELIETYFKKLAQTEIGAAK